MTSDSERTFAAIARPVALPISVLLAAIGLCAAILILAGDSPIQAGAALVEGALGSRVRCAESLSQTIPLIMTGLAVAVSFRAGFWNIGAEGQFLLGGVAAAALGTRTMCSWPLVLLSGCAAGAGWALIAGFLKTARDAPEVITTIMLNYVALQLVTFAVQGPLQERVHQQPQSDLLYPRAQLPLLLADTTLHAGLLIALMSAAACWWLFFRTATGFATRACGANPQAARIAGIPVERRTLTAVALSGGLAGLGGAIETAGATHQLGMNGFGFGYTAIAVALLCNLNPLGVIPAALFFGLLTAGGGAMERTAGLPAVTVTMLTGLVVFLVAALPRLKPKPGDY